MKSFVIGTVLLVVMVLCAMMQQSSASSAVQESYVKCLSECAPTRRFCGLSCLKKLLSHDSVKTYLRTRKFDNPDYYDEKDEKLFSLIDKYVKSYKVDVRQEEEPAPSSAWVKEYETASDNWYCYFYPCNPSTNFKKHTVGKTNEAMSESNAGANDEVLWARYRSELIKFLKQGTTTGSSSDFATLQLSSSGIPAEWDQDESILQRMCHTGSSWSQTYNPTANKKEFHSSYYDFLVDLNVPSFDPLTQDPALKSQLDSIYLQQDMVTMNLMNEEIECEDKWYSLPEYFRGKYQDFQRRRCRKVNDLLDESRILNGKAQLLFRRVAGGQKNYEARMNVNKYNSVKNKKFVELTKLKDFVQKAKSGVHNNFNVEISSASSSTTQSTYSSSFGMSVVVVSVNGAKQKKSLKTNTDAIKIKFGAKSWTSINVTPDPSWFSGDTIESFKNGPFRHGNRGTYFGSKGSINLIPKTFVVVYQPYLEMWVNKEDKDFFEKSSSFGIGLNIYGVSFNFGKSSSLTTVKETNNEFKVVMTSNSPTPQIIAVDHHILG